MECYEKVKADKDASMERVRRLQTRLKQVREQTLNYMQISREKFEQEKLRQLQMLADELTAEVQDEMAKQIEDIVEAHDLALGEIGMAHLAAQQQAENLEHVKKIKERKAVAAAKARYNIALKKEKGIYPPPAVQAKIGQHTNARDKRNTVIPKRLPLKPRTSHNEISDPDARAVIRHKVALQKERQAKEEQKENKIKLQNIRKSLRQPTPANHWRTKLIPHSQSNSASTASTLKKNKIIHAPSNAVTTGPSGNPSISGTQTIAGPRNENPYTVTSPASTASTLKKNKIIHAPSNAVTTGPSGNPSISGTQTTAGPRNENPYAVTSPASTASTLKKNKIIHAPSNAVTTGPSGNPSISGTQTTAGPRNENPYAVTSPASTASTPKKNKIIHAPSNAPSTGPSGNPSISGKKTLAGSRNEKPYAATSLAHAKVANKSFNDDSLSTTDYSFSDDDDDEYDYYDDDDDVVYESGNALPNMHSTRLAQTPLSPLAPESAFPGLGNTDPMPISPAASPLSATTPAAQQKAAPDSSNLIVLAKSTTTAANPPPRPSKVVPGHSIAAPLPAPVAESSVGNVATSTTTATTNSSNVAGAKKNVAGPKSKAVPGNPTQAGSKNVVASQKTAVVLAPRNTPSAKNVTPGSAAVPSVRSTNATVAKKNLPGSSKGASQLSPVAESSVGNAATSTTAATTNSSIVAGAKKERSGSQKYPPAKTAAAPGSAAVPSVRGTNAKAAKKNLPGSSRVPQLSSTATVATLRSDTAGKQVVSGPRIPAASGPKASTNRSLQAEAPQDSDAATSSTPDAHSATHHENPTCIDQARYSLQCRSDQEPSTFSTSTDDPTSSPRVERATRYLKKTMVKLLHKRLDSIEALSAGTSSSNSDTSVVKVSSSATINQTSDESLPRHSQDEIPNISGIRGHSSRSVELGDPIDSFSDDDPSASVNTASTWKSEDSKGESTFTSGIDSGGSNSETTAEVKVSVFQDSMATITSSSTRSKAHSLEETLSTICTEHCLEEENSRHDLTLTETSHATTDYSLSEDTEEGNDEGFDYYDEDDDDFYPAEGEEEEEEGL